MTNTAIIRGFKRTTMALCLLGLAQATSAAVVTHSSGSFNTGSSSDFDRATFSIAQQYADTITVSNFGFGYAHDHGYAGGTKLGLDVFNGSSWINIFNYTIPTAQSVNLSSVFANPITFTGLNISGFRLDSAPFNSQTYHNVNSAMTYTITGTPPSRVPEPSSIALLGLGAALLAARRKKA